jgi:hypothetical protein
MNQSISKTESQKVGALTGTLRQKAEMVNQPLCAFPNRSMKRHNTIIEHHTSMYRALTRASNAAISKILPLLVFRSAVGKITPKETRGGASKQNAPKEMDKRLRPHKSQGKHQAPDDPIEQEPSKISTLRAATTPEELVAQGGGWQEQPWGNHESYLIPGQHGSILPEARKRSAFSAICRRMTAKRATEDLSIIDLLAQDTSLRSHPSLFNSGEALS